MTKTPRASRLTLRSVLTAASLGLIATAPLFGGCAARDGTRVNNADGYKEKQGRSAQARSAQTAEATSEALTIHNVELVGGQLVRR